MRKPSIFTAKELRFLRELRTAHVPFMIVGLSAATLQGAPVVTQDIDLWFADLQHPGIQKALQRCKGTYIPPIGLNPPRFIGDQLALFDIVLTMHGLHDFHTELANTLDIEIDTLRVKVLKLDRIIKSKKSTNRPKDRLVLPVLQDALRVLKT